VTDEGLTLRKAAWRGSGAFRAAALVVAEDVRGIALTVLLLILGVLLLLPAR
jgi:hypothetical protein